MKTKKIVMSVVKGKIVKFCKYLEAAIVRWEK